MVAPEPTDPLVDNAAISFGYFSGISGHQVRMHGLSKDAGVRPLT